MSLDKEIIISIIIPCYNCEKFIYNTLQSFDQQNSKNFEIILVNDGSNDNTEKIIKDFEKKNLSYYKIQNSERGYARNFGVSKSKGKFINFFDSDDIAMDNHISTAINIINENPDIKVFHLSYLIHNIFNNSILEFKSKGVLNKKILKKNILSCNGVFLKREIAIENKFSTIRELSGSEDWELWLRLSKKYRFHGFKIITSKIIDHNLRSMRSQKYVQIEKRINKFIELVNIDKNYNFSIKEKNNIISELNSFLSLFASSNKESKLKSLLLLYKAIKINIFNIFRLRTLVIIRNLLLR